MFEQMIQQVKQKLTPEGRAFVVLCLAYALFGGTRVLFGHVPGYMIFLAPVFLMVPLLRPKAGLWAIICLTVLFERFFTLEPLQFGRYALKLYPIDLVLFGVFAGTVVRMVFRQTVVYIDRSMTVLLLFFGLVSLYLVASVWGLGDQDFSVALSTWKNYVFYGLLALTIPNLLVSQRDVRIAIKFFLWSVVLGIIFLGIGLIRGEGLWTEFTPLSTAGVRLLAFPHAFYFSLALVGLLVSNEYWDAYRKSGWIWVLMGILSLGVFASLMRHIWVAMFLSLAVSFGGYMHHGARKKMLALSSVGLGLGGVLFALALVCATLFPGWEVSRATYALEETVISRVSSIGSTTDSSISWRGTTWQGALSELKKHPLLGAGFGQRVAVESDQYHDFIEVRNIHNSWLALFVQMGGVGGMLFVLFFVLIVVRLTRLVPYGTWQHSLRIALLGLLWYEAILMLAQPYLETNLLNVVIWMTVGLALTLLRLTQLNPSLQR